MKTLAEMAMKLVCVFVLALLLCPIYNLIDWTAIVLAGGWPKINLEDDPLT